MFRVPSVEQLAAKRRPDTKRRQGSFEAGRKISDKNRKHIDDAS